MMIMAGTGHRICLGFTPDCGKNRTIWRRKMIGAHGLFWLRVGLGLVHCLSQLPAFLYLALMS